MVSKLTTSRRDFIRLLGGALGGVILAPLAGCGGGGNTRDGRRLTDSPLPTGYQFFPIIDVGQTPITPGIMINDNAEILLYSVDQASAGDAVGSVLELTMDFSGSTPAIVNMRPIVSIGDTLADGRRVDRIGVADTNSKGNFIVVVDTYAPDLDSGTVENVSGVYMEQGKAGLESLVGFRDSIPGIGRYGGSFGDISLNDNNDALLVSHFTLDDAVQSQQGLIHLPKADPLEAEVALQTGDLIPQSNGIIRSFGLTDMNTAGQYVVQVYGDAVGSGESVLQPSALLQGEVGTVNPMTLLCASASLDPADPEVVGESVFGPRISDSNVSAYVHHTSADFHSLSGRTDTVSKIITEVGATSPLSSAVQGLSAPVLGQDGLIYQLIYTDIGRNGPGVELIVSNGAENRTLLANKDITYQGLPLINILHGFHTKQVDAIGRIVFMAEFGDGIENGANTQALVIGIPV